MAQSVDAEALQRLTSLRLRLLQDQLSAGQPHQALAPPWQQHQLPYGAQHQQQQAQALVRALEAKRRQLQQLDESTQQLRQQLSMKQQHASHARPADTVNSKLDTILAQTLQMQTMFMAQVAAGGMIGAPGGAHAAGGTAGRDMDGVPRGRPHADSAPMQGVGRGDVPGAHTSAPNGNGTSGVQAFASSPDQLQELAAAAAAGDTNAAYLEKDLQLLANLEAMTVKLNRADQETHDLAEAALQKARAQDTSRNPATGSPGRKGLVGEGAGAEEEEEEEDLDEITHDEMGTLHEIALAWLSKVVRNIIINVLLEQEMNLEISAPTKGSFFKKGITSQDVERRVIQLDVRCRGLVKALVEACTKEEMPEAVITFLQRLATHRQKYPGSRSPKAQAVIAGEEDAGEGGGAVDERLLGSFYQQDGSYLFPSEREMLQMEDDSGDVFMVQERAGEITMAQARYLIAHFLFGRILVKQLLLQPWQFGVGSKNRPSTKTEGNLRVIAFIMYNALSAGFKKEDGPTQEVSILQHIGSLPGDEPFLLQETQGLQSLVRKGLHDVLDNIVSLCFPQGMPPYVAQASSKKLSLLDQHLAVPTHRAEAQVPPNAATGAGTRRDNKEERTAREKDEKGKLPTDVKKGAMAAAGGLMAAAGIL